MSLIDRGQVMLDYLENLGRADSYKAKYEALVKAVDDAPTIDAEPGRHGRWIRKIGCCKCSECFLDCWADSVLGYDYCPYCGAKMDLEEDI